MYFSVNTTLTSSSDWRKGSRRPRTLIRNCKWCTENMTPFFLNVPLHQHNADLIDGLHGEFEATTYFNQMSPLQLRPLQSLAFLPFVCPYTIVKATRVRASIDTAVLSGNKHLHLPFLRRGRATDWCCSPSPIGARRQTAFVPARPPCIPRSTRRQKETGPPREPQGPYTPAIVQRRGIRLQCANDFSGTGMRFASSPGERECPSRCLGNSVVSVPTPNQSQGGISSSNDHPVTANTPSPPLPGPFWCRNP